MKIFLFSFLFFISLCSCGPQSEADFDIVHFSHNEHDYIYFKSNSYGSTILHSPDCELKDLRK